MADRTIYAGDNYPPLKFEVSDETGVLDLSTATGLQFKADGVSSTITKTAAAIQPPVADADGIHQWNCQVALATTDTTNPDVYKLYIIVTWSTGNVETFDTGDTLTIKAAP